MNVGVKIKQRRESLNLSQEQLSQISGVSQASIHYIESGENSPTTKTLQKLATALGVSITEIVSDEPATVEQRVPTKDEGGTITTMVWYVCDGQVEEYSGQIPNWDNSVLVCAEDPEDALIKVMEYYRRRLEPSEITYNGIIVRVIA